MASISDASPAEPLNATLTAYQQGELDLMNIPLALYGETLDQEGRLNPKYASSHLRTVPLNNLKFVAFRMGAAPWGTDATLRRKVYAALIAHPS